MAVLSKEIVWKLLASISIHIHYVWQKEMEVHIKKNKRNWKKKSPNGASYLEIASSTSSFDSALKINGTVQCLYVNHGSVPLRKNLLFTLYSISTLTSPNHLNYRWPSNSNQLASGPSNLSPRSIPCFNLSFSGLISFSFRFAFNTALIALSLS